MKSASVLSILMMIAVITSCSSVETKNAKPVTSSPKYIRATRIPSSDDAAAKECRDAHGTPKDNGFCTCGSYVDFAPGYETCEHRIVKPVHITKIEQVKLAGPDRYVEDGYQYHSVYSPLVATINDQKICYLELGVGRVNDNRVMPGGAGEGGGRIVCMANGNGCPSLKECVAQQKNSSQEMTQLLWEIKWVSDQFGPFENVQQIANDQTRRSFTCHHPKTGQTKVFKSSTQDDACGQCMFWGRDDLKLAYPFGCNVCDSDAETAASSSARKCQRWN